MAWVRLHDGALSHPKVIGIFDPRRPFDLWLWSLSYSQLHLTDGHLPADALPKGSGKAVDVLTTRGLWHTDDRGGYQIHDYLDWNDSKTLVIKKRTEAKERMKNARDRSSRELLRGSGRDLVLEGVPGKPKRHSDGAAGATNPRDHLSHVFCDDSFCYCVPGVVHAKLANLLAPKHGGDRRVAGEALKAWYGTVAEKLPAGYVMGEPFAFWQRHFDAELASKLVAVERTNGRPEPSSAVPDVSETNRLLARLREPA